MGNERALNKQAPKAKIGDKDIQTVLELLSGTPQTLHNGVFTSVSRFSSQLLGMSVVRRMEGSSKK